MKTSRFLSGLVLGLALVGGAIGVQHSPAAHAGPIKYNIPITCVACRFVFPQLSASAEHTNVLASGSYFYTGGRTVYLYAYGLSNGAKTYLGYTSVVPQPKNSTDPSCFIACAAGSFWTEFSLASDPCVGPAYPQVEVDAWTTDASNSWYEAASATGAYDCSPPPQIN